MGHRVGVDVGGTFTDVVTVTDGTIDVTKVPSTPENPDDGVLDGLRDAQLVPDAVDFLAHGTTVATNAVLERDWAETALVTTAGFRDVLEIGRQARPDLYDLQSTKPDPIVPRNLRFGVDERLDERGEVEAPIDEDSLEATVSAVETAGVESVAICSLFSFENDAHERRIADTIRETDPSLDISRSSRIHPEIREYERTLVTALNAALTPVMDRYIGRLVERLDREGIHAPLRIMQSNGGLTPGERARHIPVKTLLSGPAAGVEGAAHVAGLAGHDDLLTMDMGGTSCDVSLVEDGEPVVSTDVEVDRYPVSVPMIDVHTIGAGGGSIAWIDEGGALRVGPRSAGADPGPVCYGRGGSAPTVTDAHVALGRIDPTAFPSAALDPAPAAAREAIGERIASRLDESVEAAANGILRVANANMERALRVVSVERGHDPRDFALVSYGGAGPLHATAIAKQLDIPRVLVPRSAGVLSALGLVLTDVVHDFSTSHVRPWDEVDPDDLDARFEAFAAEGRRRLSADDIDPGRIETDRRLEMRYRGQSFTLSVTVPPEMDGAAMPTVADRFHERHERRYGHASPTEPIELVTIRMRVRGLVDPPKFRTAERTDGERTARTTRTVRFSDGAHETAIVPRNDLAPGATLDGPTVVEGTESTVLIHPDQVGHVDPYGTLIVETQERART